MANNIQPEMIRTTKNQRERFAYALEQVVGKDHVRDGIGTLSEKTVHAVLKYYYEPDSSHHEIPLEKSVADIFTGDAAAYKGAVSFKAKARQIFSVLSCNSSISDFL